MDSHTLNGIVSVLFSEPKIPQLWVSGCVPGFRAGFSALQRAENSSIDRRGDARRRELGFQCSSASRKFLNVSLLLTVMARLTVSVLFSEPKIPQCNIRVDTRRGEVSVSVLFSEPKIPQTKEDVVRTVISYGFQCSSASRKFLKSISATTCVARSTVSVLFSEPKIPQII